MKIAKPVSAVIDKLQQFPGIGPRSAERLTYFLLRKPEEDVLELAQSLIDLRQKISVCDRCFNISEQELCEICVDSQREQQAILVVEEPLDVIAVEKSGAFKGVYHVLGGVIDPIRGIGAESLRMNELFGRIKQLVGEHDAVELIIGTNPSTEGETTALYIKSTLEELGLENTVTMTRIARGLPIGGDVEYADPMTLQRALEGRSQF